MYEDGSESAISSYSELFVPPGYLIYQGQSDVEYLNQNNRLSLSVPLNEMSEEVVEIKVLMRRGDNGAWFYVKSFDYEHDGVATTYDFNFDNDLIGTAASKDVQIKQFDDVPERAEAQTIIDNRLLYGNYLSGFDNVDISASFVPQHNERPEDFKTYNIQVLPSTCPSPSPNGQVGQNKNIGFTLDLSSVSTGVEEGSFVTFSFNVSPKENFHIYNVENTGYHQSPQMGEDFDNRGYQNSGLGTTANYDGSQGLGEQGISPITGHPYGFYWQDEIKSGGRFIKNQVELSQGSVGFRCPAVCSNGVNHVYNDGGASQIKSRFKWRHFDMMSMNSGIDAVSDVDFGTSAGNPLIVQGRPITIGCSFTANKELSPAEVAEALTLILSGAPTSKDPENLNRIDELAREINYPGDEDLEYSVDLGLVNGSTRKETHPVSKLINMVGSTTALLRLIMAGLWAWGPTATKLLMEATTVPFFLGQKAKEARVMT